MCCGEGQEIDYTDLKTPEQQQVMSQLGGMLSQNIGQTATAYPGQLSQAPDAGMLAAMNTMMNVGGYGNYTAPAFQGGGYQFGGSPSWDRERRPYDPTDPTRPDRPDYPPAYPDWMIRKPQYPNPILENYPTDYPENLPERMYDPNQLVPV